MILKQNKDQFLMPSTVISELICVSYHFKSVIFLAFLNKSGQISIEFRWSDWFGMRRGV